MHGSVPYLYATSIPIFVALVGVLGNRWLAGVRSKATENEQRLRSYEAYDHTYANLRADYDRVTRELAEERATTAGLRADVAERDIRLTRQDRQIERLLESKEKKP